MKGPVFLDLLQLFRLADSLPWPLGLPLSLSPLAFPAADGHSYFRGERER